MGGACSSERLRGAKLGSLLRYERELGTEAAGTERTKNEEKEDRNKTLQNTNLFHLFYPWRGSLVPAVPWGDVHHSGGSLLPTAHCSPCAGLWAHSRASPHFFSPGKLLFGIQHLEQGLSAPLLTFRTELRFCLVAVPHRWSLGRQAVVQNCL